MKVIFIILSLISSTCFASVQECTSESMQKAMTKALAWPLFLQYQENRPKVSDLPMIMNTYYICNSLNVVKVKENSTIMQSPQGLTATLLFDQYVLVNYDGYEVSFPIGYGCPIQDLGKMYLFSLGNYRMNPPSTAHPLIEFSQPTIVTPGQNYNGSAPKKPLCVVKARSIQNPYQFYPVSVDRGYDDILEKEIYQEIVKTDVATPSDCFEFNNGTIVKFNCSGTTDVVIPEKINNQLVTAIGENAFSGREINSVFIPDSVESIGFRAFSGNELTHIAIPKSVKTIGKAAFLGNQLTDIVIPDSLTKIEGSTFAGNQLNHVVIPNSIATIGREAFASNKITIVTIPDSVLKIEQGAFIKNNLTKVQIPKNTQVEHEAFDFNVKVQK